MTDHAYMNREIDEKFENLLEHMKGFEEDVKSRLDSLVEQTTKTNGRVRWSEKMIYLAIGGIGVLSVVVFPLLLALIQNGKL